MKLFGQHVGGMYLWTIFLLTALVVIASYTSRVLPIGVAAAVLFGSVIETIAKKYFLNQKPSIPFSGIITGLIIGSIVPPEASILLIFLASLIGVISKLFLKFKGSNIFNPAALGLITSLFLFRVGDEWWVASNYNVFGVAITLTPILIILAYKAKRLPLALSFAIVSIALSFVISGAAASAGALIASIFSVNYYFAFVMLIEPKTSPNNKSIQVLYGILLSLLYAALALSEIMYPILISLLLGNLGYLVYRKYRRR